MDNKNYSYVRLQAHRGVANEYPENTMPAFEAAIEQGYPIIELDPKHTADGKFVILHDRTLKRTGRNEDGAPVEKAIAEITYEEALTYDFGLWFGEKFRGTKLPTLGEVLDLAAKNPQIALKLDNVWQSFDEEHRAAFLSEIAAHGAKNVGITCSSPEMLEQAAKAVPFCELHYDGGDLSDEMLCEVKRISEGHKLIVWICFDNSHTKWFKGTKADREVCARVKKTSGCDIGLWLLTEREELEKAVKEFGANVIETDGSLKPGFVANM